MAESLGEAVLSVRLDSGGLTNSLARLRSDSEGALSGVERKAQATASGMEGAFKRGIENSGRAFDSLAERASTSFASLVGPTGIAAAAIGAVGLAARASINTFADFEQRMKGVQAVLQASGAEMEQLNQVALTTGAETKFSASEAAAAIEELAKQGLSASEIMGGALAGTTDLAAAAGIGLAEAANIASVAMKAFNLEARDLPAIADTIAAAANSSALDVGDLGQALQALGPVGRDAGLSFEEVSASLAKLADNGIRGSDAGTSLKTMLQSLTPNTDKAKKAFADLNVSIFDSNGNYRAFQEIVDQMAPALSKLTQQQRAVALETIFGSDATRAASIIFGSSGKSIATYTAEVTKVGEASQNAKTRQDSLRAAQEQLAGSVETLAIRFGQALAPALRSGTNLATSFFNALNDGNPVVVAATGAIAGLVSVITVNGLIAAFRSIIAIAPALGASFTVAFGPLGWVVAGVTALTAGLVALIAQEKEAARVASQQRQAREYGASTTEIEGELNRLIEWRGTLYQRLRHAENEKNEAGIKYNKQQLADLDKQIEKQRTLLQVTKDTPRLQQEMTDRYANYNTPAGGGGPVTVGADFSKAVEEAKRLQAAVEAAIKANDPKAWQAATDALELFKKESEDNAQALAYLSTQTKAGAKATNEYQNALDRIKGVDFRNSLDGMTDAQLKLAAAQAKAKNDADTYAVVVGELTQRQQAARRETEAAAQALGNYLDGRKLDKYAQGLENATDKQLEMARAVALTSGDLARLQRIDAEIDRRADVRAQKDEQHKAAIAAARKEVLEYAQALEKQTRSGELTSESIRDNAEKFTALKARLAEAGVSWNELDGTVRNRVNGALAAQLSLLQRLEYQHTRQIQLTRDLAEAEKELANRLQYQGERLAGLAAETAGAVLQGVYDALNTNDPLNIQGALDKTNAFIESDGFPSLPPSLQQAVRDAIPLMQAVLDDEANLRAQVDLEPVYAGITSANVERLERWAKDAVGAVVDYLETDTTDLEQVRDAITHSLKFDDLDDGQVKRLNAQLTAVKETLGAIETARTNYAAAEARDLQERENGLKTVSESLEESIELYRRMNNEAEGGAAAEAMHALNAALEDLPGVNRLRDLFTAFDAVGEGAGEWLAEALAGGDVDAIAAQLQKLPHEVLQKLAPEFINAGDDLGKTVYTAILRGMVLRSQQVTGAETPSVPFGEGYTDYALEGRLDTLAATFQSMDLIELADTLEELNGYLALPNLDPDVLARVEDLSDRTEAWRKRLNELVDEIAKADGLGQMMADLVPLFEALGDVWGREVSDALSDSENFDPSVLAEALKTLTDDALQELYAYYATLDTPFAVLLRQVLDLEAAKRALAKETDEGITWPSPEPAEPEVWRRRNRSAPTTSNGRHAGARNVLIDLDAMREGLRLGIVTNDEYRASLQTVIDGLEGIKNPSQATKNRLAELKAELENLNNPTARVLSGFEALSNLLRSFEDVTLNGLATVIQTGVSAFRAFAAKDFIGGIATVAQTIVQAFTAARREAEAFRKEFDGIVKSFKVIDPTSLIKTKTTRGGFLGLGTKTEVDREASQLGLTIAEALEGGVKSGLASGFRAFLEGTGDILSGLRDGIKGAIITAITEAVIQGAIIKGALGTLLTQLTDAFARGDYAAAAGIIRSIGDALPGLVQGLETALAPLRDAWQTAFPTERPPAGSLAELQDQRSSLQDKFNLATSDDERRNLQAQIDNIDWRINQMQGGASGNPFGTVNLPSIGIQSAIATPILESAQSFKLSTDALGVHVNVFGAAANLFNAATSRFDATITRLEQAAANGTAGLRYA